MKLTDQFNQGFHQVQQNVEKQDIGIPKQIRKNLPRCHPSNTILDSHGTGEIGDFQSTQPGQYKQQNLNTKKQYGFLPGRNTMDAIIKVLEDWERAKESEMTTHAVFQDFEKAFDLDFFDL